MTGSGSCERYGRDSAAAGWLRPLMYAVPLFVCMVLGTRAWFNGWAGAVALGAYVGLMCYGAQFLAQRRRRCPTRCGRGKR